VLRRILKREARTKTASLLAERPVIVVWPHKYCGKVIWDGLGVVINDPHSAGVCYCHRDSERDGRPK
jgi:hypothetical protein